MKALTNSLCEEIYPKIKAFIVDSKVGVLEFVSLNSILYVCIIKNLYFIVSLKNLVIENLLINLIFKKLKLILIY